MRTVPVFFSCPIITFHGWFFYTGTGSLSLLSLLGVVFCVVPVCISTLCQHRNRVCFEHFRALFFERSSSKFERVQFLCFKCIRMDVFLVGVVAQELRARTFPVLFQLVCGITFATNFSTVACFFEIFSSMLKRSPSTLVLANIAFFVRFVYKTSDSECQTYKVSKGDI